MIVFQVPQNNFKLQCSKEIFQRLIYFNISSNRLQNGQQLIELHGSFVQTLDLSTNFVGKLSANTFERFNNLQILILRNTNLSNFGFGTFYHQKNLIALDLSFNKLKNINFTLLYQHFKHLETLNIEGNDITEINTINRFFPRLKRSQFRRITFYVIIWPDICLNGMEDYTSLFIQRIK